MILMMGLTGCGRHQKSTEEQTSIESQNSIELENELQNDESMKLQSTPIGNTYYFFGATKISNLPQEFKSLPSGTEIGTVSVQYENSIFHEQYLDKVLPEVNFETYRTNESVFLIKNKSNQEAYFAVSNQNGKLFETQTTSVQVQSKPRKYCSKLSIQFKYLSHDTDVYVKDQVANCYSSNECIYRLHQNNRYGDVREGIKKLIELTGGVCSEEQIIFKNNEQKLNTIKATSVEIDLEKLSNKTKKITINLLHN
jgi:hypothetical protein